jgi:hypothetical protein
MEFKRVIWVILSCKWTSLIFLRKNILLMTRIFINLKNRFIRVFVRNW